MTEKTAQKEPGKKPVPSKKPKPQQEVVVQIPLSELHPFPDHPFRVREEASMQETAESVKEYGVLVPALARPREDGGYGSLPAALLFSHSYRLGNSSGGSGGFLRRSRSMRRSLRTNRIPMTVTMRNGTSRMPPISTVTSRSSREDKSPLSVN